LWLHSLKVAQLLRSAACLHTNQSRSYLNHLVLFHCGKPCSLSFRLFEAKLGPVHLELSRLYYIYKALQLKSKPQHAGAWSAVAWPHCRLSYRPAVFFHHFRLTSLSLPEKKKNSARVEKHVLSVFTFSLIA